MEQLWEYYKTLDFELQLGTAFIIFGLAYLIFSGYRKLKPHTWFFPTTETFLYMREGSGTEAIGWPANIGKRQGKVVKGTDLTITVRFEPYLWSLLKGFVHEENK